VNDLPCREDGTVDVLALLRESTPLLSDRELDDDGPYDREARLAEEARRSSELIKQANVRLWSALMLARGIETCESILRRLPVRAGNLDRVALQHALRGARLPSAETYIPVSDEMLDAIAEAGPLKKSGPLGLA
jgi:hypothetical protein